MKPLLDNMIFFKFVNRPVVTLMLIGDGRVKIKKFSVLRAYKSTETKLRLIIKHVISTLLMERGSRYNNDTLLTCISTNDRRNVKSNFFMVTDIKE